MGARPLRVLLGQVHPDPEFSEAHRRFVEADPDVLTEGYTTTAEHPRGAGYHWICKSCFDDFAERFAWRTVAGDDEANVPD